MSATISRPPHSATRAPRRGVGAGHHPRQAALVGGNQRQRRRKRHLEARMHDRLRREQQHAEGRDRERAERQRRPVGHHADQHDRGHDEGALGRDLGARQQQIAERRDQRADRGPFLDRAGAGEAGDQRQAGAQHEEHHARHQCHVIAGDRQHVGEARDVHGVVDRRRDRVALAGDQRRGDGAAVARQHRADAGVEAVAEPWIEAA